MKTFKFDNSYLTLNKSLYTIMKPESVISSKTVIYNDELSDVLGLEKCEIEKYLSGSHIIENSEPFAQAYAGHQFGQLNVLGDGRTVLLGEHLDPNNNRVDIQLKGSGRTPYSRNGDGKATLYSMLREYVISHAMDKLGITTTKSLAVVTTGENVYREKIHKGAVLTRIASSHIRVGTFQFVAMQGDLQLLKEFTDYVINRHYPDIQKNSNPYTSLLVSVMDRQIELIVNWMRVGFIHGVMNTDNVSISGETIDYGPCAFMDIYNPNTVFSSIDVKGRYGFANQEYIGQWNMARFAETLLPLVDTDDEISLKIVNEVIASYNDKFKTKWYEMMFNKLGLINPEESDKALVLELLSIMETNNLDYTNTFRNLSSKEFLNDISYKIDLETWYKKWTAKKISLDLMNRTNPEIIPRNHIVEAVLNNAAFNNDFEGFHKLLNVLNKPYNDIEDKSFKTPPEIIDINYQTFCGT